jgi:hypothetical protein
MSSFVNVFFEIGIFCWRGDIVCKLVDIILGSSERNGVDVALLVYCLEIIWWSICKKSFGSSAVGSTNGLLFGNRGKRSFDNLDCCFVANGLNFDDRMWCCDFFDMLNCCDLDLVEKVWSF